ncbi:hypothetical protein AB1K32_23270 [Metabacillus dongyingensis]|uniref:DUF1659 domain-containing protein n=1 Tax=Metabacillus dongyingensis TaxID=2874282 RepID=UPI003B8E1DC7
MLNTKKTATLKTFTRLKILREFFSDLSKLPLLNINFFKTKRFTQYITLNWRYPVLDKRHIIEDIKNVKTSATPYQLLQAAQAIASLQTETFAFVESN